MFQMVKRRLRDVRTLATLCKRAEEIAHEQGRAKPGSEHFILAALALPDRTAAGAFQQLGLTEEKFREALHSQRVDALRAVGVTVPETAFSTTPVGRVPESRLYEAEPSGQALVKRLYDAREARGGRTLLGADVVLAVAQENHTPSSRAFHWLGVSKTALANAANHAIAAGEAA